jgi:Arc/MetJ-type ribon-helix-helix transcriptional regulator
MGYQFPPNLERLVQERMTTGQYRSEEELLLDAMVALEDVERRRDELRSEIRRRISTTGSALSQPLDIDAFKQEVRRHGNGK